MSPEELKKQEQLPPETPEVKTTTLEELENTIDANVAATSEEFVQSLEKAKENPSLPEGVSLALGELKLDAKAVASEAKEEIEAVVNGEDHEIYEGLSDPEKLESVDIESLHDQAKGLRKAQRKFNKAFGEVSGIKDKKQRAQEAVSFTQQEGFEADSLSAEQLAQVFTTLKSGSEFGQMINLYRSAKSEIFKESPITREFLGVALHKEALRLMKENPQGALGVLQESESVIQELISEGKANGEAYAILGKIYKIKHDKFGEEHSLEQSIDNLDKGYKAGFEFYPGVNLAYNKLSQSVEQGNEESIDQSLKLFELANVSAEKAGGKHSNDFWALTTLLETSVVMGQRDIDLLERVMSKGKVDWEINAPIENLKRLGEQLKSVDPKKFEQVIQNVEWAVNSLGQRLSEIQSGSESKREHVSALPENESDEMKATNLIFQKGISYGEITTFVGGNIKYGGQLHDYTVNRWDVSVARQILKDTGLEDTTDFNEFNQKIDAMIRERYQTEPLEDLHSDEHKEFDGFMKNLNGVMNVEKGDDSRTNIMVDFYLGKGDCRQHAHTKQLFFDAWKTDATNKLMAQAYEALNSNDEATYQGSLAKAKELTRTQMMVFDSVVKAQIEMNQKYDTKRDNDGNLKKTSDGSFSEVEDHTWNGLMKLDENGVISEFRMVDSFYQNEYKFGGNTEQNGEQQAGIPIDYKEILTEGFSGGKIKTDSGEVEVRLVPTVYAGDRAARVIESGDDLALPKLRGLMMGKFEGDNRYSPDLSHVFADDTIDSIKKFTKKVREEGVITKKTLAEAEGHN